MEGTRGRPEPGRNPSEARARSEARPARGRRRRRVARRLAGRLRPHHGPDSDHRLERPETTPPALWPNFLRGAWIEREALPHAVLEVGRSEVRLPLRSLVPNQ